MCSAVFKVPLHQQKQREERGEREGAQRIQPTYSLLPCLLTMRCAGLYLRQYSSRACPGYTGLNNSATVLIARHVIGLDAPMMLPW